MTKWAEDRNMMPEWAVAQNIQKATEEICSRLDMLVGLYGLRFGVENPSMKQNILTLLEGLKSDSESSDD